MGRCWDAFLIVFFLLEFSFTIIAAAIGLTSIEWVKNPSKIYSGATVAPLFQISDDVNTKALKQCESQIVAGKFCDYNFEDLDSTSSKAVVGMQYANMAAGALGVVITLMTVFFYCCKCTNFTVSFILIKVCNLIQFICFTSIACIWISYGGFSVPGGTGNMGVALILTLTGIALTFTGWLFALLELKRRRFVKNKEKKKNEATNENDNKKSKTKSKNVNDKSKDEMKHDLLKNEGK